MLTSLNPANVYFKIKPHIFLRKIPRMAQLF